MPDMPMPVAPGGPAPGGPVPPTAGAPLPALMGARPGMGGATSPQGNPGNVAAAIQKAHQAVRLLQEALPAIPMGSTLHTEALDIIKRLVKAIPSQDQEQSGPDMTSIVQMLRQQSQNAPQAALARLTAQPGGTPPAMPQAQAA